MGCRTKTTAKVIKFTLAVSLLLFSANSFAEKWYPLVTGDWDDPFIWTTDASGSLWVNPDTVTPTTSPTSATDEVVILSGRTIYVSSDNKSNAKLTVTGKIDFRATAGHTFTEIRGSGKIVLKADNFPSGNAIHFISKDQGEGTVIFDSTGYTLNTAHTFYNVEVNLDNPTDILILMADYQIDGNLTISSGVFQINDNTSPTAINLNVKGNTLIKTGTSFTVGSGNVVHNVDFEGNVTNNGTIDFANDAQYNCATTGAVKVIFSGASHNTLTCNGTTDFYRMFLEKGTDDSYILSVISTNTANFRLYGPVAGGGCLDAGAEGWENLALVLHNGTLKLGSNIDIPVLGKNRAGTASPYEFHVPSGAKLWIDGADVATSDDGGGWRGFTLFGTLQISSGTFTNPDNTGGITFFSNVGAPGKLVITGGEIFTTQVKQANASGMFSYVQTGGSLYINTLSDSRASSAVFALPDPDHTFEMSGGLIQINAINTTMINGIHILCDEGNYNVTGGTFQVMLPTLDAAGEDSFKIYSTAPLYNLTLTESANPGTQILYLKNDLTILNDLTIGANTELDADGFDLSVGGDFILEDGGTYTHGNNTTRFIGAANSQIVVENTAATAPLLFYDFEIEKDQNSNPNLFWDVELTSPGRTAGTVPLRVLNNMTLSRGSFNTGTFNMQMYGDTLEIEDGTITNDTGGKITLTGSATQHTLKGAYAATNQSFGHIDLNNTNGVKLLSDIKATDITLNAANTLFTLDIYNLEVTNSINGWSALKYFVTAGNSSDGGLRLHFTLTGNYIGEQLVATFPVGSPAGYSRAAIYIDGYDFGATSLSGSVQVTPVNSRHPGAPAGGFSIAYYWVSQQSGFDAVPNGQVIYRFYPPTGITKAGSHRDQGLIGSEWYQSNYANNAALLQFRHANHGIVDGEFSSGNPGQFGNRRTLYSRNSGDWHTKANWSLSPHGGPQPGLGGGDNLPQATDICVIGLGHRINATTAGFTIGRLEFSHDTSVNHGFEDIPRVQINGNYNFDFGKVVGTGMFTQWIDNANNPVVTGDFGDFANEKYSWYLYVAEADNVSMPTTQTVFPNLALETNTGDWHLIFTEDIHVNYNLNPRGTSILLLNNGADGDIYVGGNCYIGDWGDAKIQFPSTGTERTLTIMGNLDFTSEAAGFTATNYREIQVLNTTPSSLEHQLVVGGDIIQGVGILDLYNAGATANNVILRLIGDNNGTFTRTGTELSQLYRIELNKTVGKDFIFDDDFTLNGPTTGYPKALELISGDLQIKDGDVDITLSGGGADFRIPSTSSLLLEGESGNNAVIRISGDNTGLFLDGLLTLSDYGHAYFNGGTNNYIQYSASGNAQIDIYEGELRVGSQIRRSLYTEQGILKFHQLDAASTVIIGENSAPEGSRGVFEILNTGSEFSQVANANVTIVRQQTGSSFASIYLDPSTCNIGAGAGFTMGNTSTPASQIISIYSTKNLKNISISNAGGFNPTLQMLTLPLTIEENLNIGAGTTFDANGLNLYLNGNFTNAGSFMANNNTTYFQGSSDQVITGNTTFYNLIKTSSTDLSLVAASTNITITNELNIQAGTITDNSNNILVEGKCNMEGVHLYGGANDGIALNGGDEQELTGDGTFGKLTINNPSGVIVPLGNNIFITNSLNLQSGIFNIGKNLLTLGLNAIVEGAPFSLSNMIQTNVSFTDNGVKKIFPQKILPAPSSTFTYPIGAEGKYTPVIMTITENANNTGSITVKAADEMHPSIVEDLEAPDYELTDKDNVLQYHWVIRSSGISGFSATVNMQYDPADVKVLSPYYDIYDYITARLLNDGSGNWNKFDDVDKFDETNHWLVFDFAVNSDNEISGDYTAGVDGSTFLGAIPDQVPAYETQDNGLWIASGTWDPNINGGPRGSITIVNLPHIVTSTTNGISNYSTRINGTVLLNTTYAHRFGEVEGTGTIYLQRGSLPAGIYDDFFSATGGTIEYGGTTDYDVLPGIYQLNSIKFSGTGDRNLPNNNLFLYGDFEINGGGTLDVICYEDREIELKGDLIFTSGNFDAKIGTTSSILFSSAVAQNISGDFTGANALNRVEIDNSNGVALSGDVEIEDQLTLTNGFINTGSNSLTIALNAAISPASGSNTQYIDGELTKMMNASQDFVYPVGDNGHLGVIELVDVTGFSGSGGWSAQYFYTNPTINGYDASDFQTPPINYVSQTEYWSVRGPAGAQSHLTITLDGSSEVANAISSLSDLRFVGWSTTNSRWEQVGGTPVISGTAVSGTISTGSLVDFDDYRYITLASVQVITLATASITSGDATICDGETTDISFFLTGTQPWSITYTDGTPSTVNGITSSPYILSVSPSSTTTYTLTAVSDDNGAGILVGDIAVTITVNSSPTAVISNNSTGNQICDNEEIVFTASGGVNYDFHLNGASDQSSALETYTTTTLNDQDEVFVVVTGSNGCSDTSNTTTITVLPIPIPTLSSDDADNEICEGTNVTFTAGGGINYEFFVEGASVLGPSGTNTYSTITLNDGETVTVTVDDGNCTVTHAGIQITVNLLPAITGVTYNNPTTCGGSDGSIVIAITGDAGTYNIDINGGGTDYTAALAAGNLTISGLSAGVNVTSLSIQHQTTLCSDADASTGTLADPTTPAITGVTYNNPTTCSGSDGSIVIAITGDAGTYNIDINGGGTDYTAALAAGNLTISGLSAGVAVTNLTITHQTTLCSDADASTGTLADPTTPAITGVTYNNPTTCGGSDGSIVIAITGDAGTYNIDINGGGTDYTAALAAGNLTISGLSAGVAITNLTITHQTTLCSDADASTGTLVDPTTPAITGITYNNPTTCGGSDGSIVIAITGDAGTYNIDINGGGTDYTAALAAGNLTISGLSAGVAITNLTITHQTTLCSDADASTGTLADPTTPAITGVTYNNPTTCGGSDGSIVIAITGDAGTYNIDINGGGTDYTAALAAGNLTISGLSAGVAVTNFTITHQTTLCSDADASTGTLADPTTPAITGVTYNNPTTCGGSNGSIVIAVTGDAGIYNIDINGGGTDYTAALAAGNLTISGLSAGVAVTNLTVTHQTTLCSDADASTGTLADPTTPAITGVTYNNPTTCGGSNGSIVIAITGDAGTYNIDINGGGTDYTAVLAAGNLTISGLSAGVAVTNLTITHQTTLCSDADASTGTLADPTTPAITGVTYNNPTTCGGSNGSIVIAITGDAGTYNIDINGGGTDYTAALAAGNLTISGLSAGVAITNLTITHQTTLCSDADASTGTLVDPTTPAITGITYNNPTTCGGSDGSIVIAITGDAGTYNIDINGGGTDYTAALAAGNLTISGLSAGVAITNLTITHQTTLCSDADASTGTLADPTTPAITGVTYNNPTTCGGSDGSIVIAITGDAGTYNIDINGGGTDYTAALAAGNLTISGLSAGVAVTNFTITHQTTLCSDADASTGTLADPTTPAITGVTYNNPTTCGGSNGSIVISVTGDAGTYNIDINGGGTDYTAALAAGSLTIGSLSAGVAVTNLTITHQTTLCSDADASTGTLADPTTPAITGVTYNNPTTCGGSNGSIVIALTGDAGTYNIDINGGGTDYTAALAAGNLTISGLSAGINVTSLSIQHQTTLCSDADASTGTLADPTTPAITGVTYNNPTTCGGSNGSIVIAVTGDAGTYNIDINGGGTDYTAALAAGNLTISGLSAGVAVTNLTITHQTTLCSDADASTGTVADPTTPAITGVTYNNPTTCGGSNGSIVIAVTGDAGTYNIDINGGGTDYTAALAAGNLTISGLSAGVAVTNLTITHQTTLCSDADASTGTLADPTTPAITGVTYNNPTTCGGSNGSIVIAVTGDAGTYNIDINGGGTDYTAALAAGNLTISGLSAGVAITNLTITHQTTLCSDADASTGTLVNPALPAGTLTVDDADNTLCTDETAIFTATDGINYNFLVDGVSMQNGASDTYNHTFLTVGVFEITVEVTNGNNCTTTYAPINMTINLTPDTGPAYRIPNM